MALMNPAFMSASPVCDFAVVPFDVVVCDDGQLSGRLSKRVRGVVCTATKKGCFEPASGEAPWHPWGVLRFRTATVIFS
jgi:hypothetical protein